MPKVTVKTGTTQDGEFDLDLKQFTLRERAYIKQIAGTRPPEFLDQWFGQDPMTVVATVAVMMQRAGRVPDIDVLLDADDKAILIDYTDLEEQAKAGGDGPPSPSPSENDELGEKPDGSETSGLGSSRPTVRPVNGRKRTGSRSSVTTAASPPPP